MAKKRKPIYGYNHIASQEKAKRTRAYRGRSQDLPKIDIRGITGTFMNMHNSDEYREAIELSIKIMKKSSISLGQIIDYYKTLPVIDLADTAQMVANVSDAIQWARFSKYNSIG